MKRFYGIFILTCILLFLCLVGCGGATVESSEDTTATQEVTDTVVTTAPQTEESTTAAVTTEAPIEVVKTDFELYQSNSITPSSANYALKSTDGKPVRQTFRGVYKIQEFGTLEYKFYFSNNVDSTFSNGSHSYRNMPTESYKIISASVGTYKTSQGQGTVKDFKTLTFDGKTERDVAAGETFWSDAITLTVPNGYYLIFEWTVEYTVIAATNSENASCFLYDYSSGKITLTQSAPMPALIGAKRDNALRVGFIGDSITMGIGTGAGTHRFWAAKITEKAGTDISFWNLGVGFARANDAVNSPSWLEKAKNNDVIVICFGVNDIEGGAYNISRQRTAQQVADDINTIAATCKEAGCEVIIFSTPPFTYSSSAKVKIWQELTLKLKELAEDKGYDFFDFASYLGKADDPSTPAYGGHPNAQGCEIVANAFMESGLLEKYLKK